MAMGNEFERWLDRELPATVDPALFDIPATAPRYSAIGGGRRFGVFIQSVFATVGAKVALGGVVAVSAASIAVTGSANPVVWVQNASSAVGACGADLQPGAHGIGGCVSEFGKHHASGSEDERRAGSGNDGQGPTDTPSATPRIDGRESPEPTETPSASPRTDQSESPEPTETPRPTDSSGEDRTGEASPTPNPGEDGRSTPSPEPTSDGGHHGGDNSSAPTETPHSEGH